MSLWDEVLPVVQAINRDGGNFTSMLLSRSVIDLIDQAAGAGEAAAATSRDRMRQAVRQGNWPHDPNAFNSLFENYHEGLIYLLAKARGVTLHHIVEASARTPDFAADASGENLEVKTLDLSGSTHAYPAIAEDGRRRNEEALTEARKKGIGTAASSINPHGTEEEWRGVMQRVMRQIGQNIKEGQFKERPTTLIVALPRTSIHSDEHELTDQREDPHLGRVNGHLWTLAAHKAGDTFWWPHPQGYQPDDREENDNGPLQQNGILRDFPFVQGVIFLETILSELGSADFFDSSILARAYKLNGIWNDAFEPLDTTPSTVADPMFFRLCDAYKRMT